MKRTAVLLLASLSIYWAAEAQTSHTTINGTPPPYVFTGGGVTQLGSTFTFSGGAGATPGGVDTNVQYNSLGTFQGATHFLTNGTHQSMGTTGGIDTGQYNFGFGPTGTTTNILNLQETSTSAAGEHGIVSSVTYAPNVLATDFTYRTGGINQISLNADGQAGTHILVAGTFGSAFSTGNTTAVGEIHGGVYTGTNAGNANVTLLYGLGGEVFNEGTGTVTHMFGLDGLAELDAGTATELYGADIGYYVEVGAAATTAAAIHIDDSPLFGHRDECLRASFR